MDDDAQARRPGDGAERLASGPLSRVYALDGPERRAIVKLAPADVVAREADVLRQLDGWNAAPRVLAAGPGVIVLSFVDGELVPGRQLGAHRAHLLGAAVRDLHESRITAWGRWPEWQHAESTLAGYHQGVCAAVRSMAAGDEGVDRVLSVLPALPEGEETPFRRLHGDLWSGNVLWDGDRPALIDWEYVRQGDPAEELAYLIELDDLDEATIGALLDGYGAPGLRPRIEAWRPLVALASGLWYGSAGDHARGDQLLAQARERVA